MASRVEQYSLPDEIQDTSAKDTRRQQPAVAVKEVPTPAAPTASADGTTVSLKDVKAHVTCALCAEPLAACLVLSCGHQYCGSCLFDYLGNKPSCPNCQVPLRAIPMRCIALDGVVEAFMASRPEQEIAAFKARQEEGRSAANKVNKMFWWLQPSVTPGLPGAGPAGMMGPGGAGMMGPGMPCAGPAGMMGGPKHSTPFQGAMSHPAVAAAASNMMGAGSSSYNNHGNNNGRGLPPSGGSGGAGHHRRASQPGMPPVHSFPRHNGRSNSFSAGGAGPSGMGNQALPPQMAASIAAASFTQPPSMPLGSAGGSADLEAAYLATAQKFGMEGFALPLVYQQQLQQQQLALQQQEHFRGLLNACNDLANADLTASPPNNQSYADPAQLQQLLQGLYFA